MHPSRGQSTMHSSNDKLMDSMECSSRRGSEASQPSITSSNFWSIHGSSPKNLAASLRYREHLTGRVSPEYFVQPCCFPRSVQKPFRILRCSCFRSNRSRASTTLPPYSPKVHSALTPARQTIGPSRNKLERAHAKLVSELDGEYRKPQSDGRNVGLTPR